MSDARYLLDSNILIYLLRGRSMALRNCVETHAPGELVTSAIAYAEVMRGIDPDDDGQVVAAGRLFAVIEVLPFGRDAASCYVRVPFKRGQFDRLIAAHALAAGLTLVTNDISDFHGIADLMIENWT